jgi:hypothetical protein
LEIAFWILDIIYCYSQSPGGIVNKISVAWVFNVVLKTGMTDLTPYSALLDQEKWISKIDFIYRLKSTCDCTTGRHQLFLQLLFRLNFRQIKRGHQGEILVL